MQRIWLIFTTLFTLSTLFAGNPPAAPYNLRFGDFNASNRSIQWDGPDCGNDYTNCYQYIHELRDITANEIIYPRPGVEQTPQYGKSLSLPQDRTLFEGHIYQVLVYSYKEDSGFSVLAGELTFVWNGYLPQPLTDNHVLNINASAPADPPTLSVSPTSTPTQGRYYFGFRDAGGTWLVDDWLKTSGGGIHNPALPPGVTYDVYVARATNKGRTDARRLGSVVYPGPRRYHREGSLANYGETSGTLLNQIGFNTPFLNKAVHLSDLKFGIFNDRGQLFDGSAWRAGNIATGLPFLTVANEGLTPKRGYQFNVNANDTSKHTLRFFWRDDHPTYADYLAFWHGAGPTLTTQIQVDNSNIGAQVTQARAPQTTTVTPARQDLDAMSTVQVSIQLNHAALNNQNLRWLWFDLDTGRYWDGDAWLSREDQPPWQNLRTNGQIQQTYWPQSQLSLNPQYQQLSLSYRLGSHAATFFDGRAHRRIGIVLDTNQAPDLDGPVIAEVTFLNRFMALQGFAGVNQWGITSQDEFLQGLIINADQRLPVAASIHVEQTQLAGITSTDPRALVLRLYEPRDGGFAPIGTSQPLPLRDLIHNGNPVVMQQMQSRVQAALASLITNPETAPLLERPFDDPYRLAVFMTDQPASNAQERSRLSPQPFAAETQFVLSLAGQNLQLIDREDAQTILDRSTTLHARIFPEQQPIGFLTQQDSQSEPKALGFPEERRWRAVANRGDRLTPRLLNEGVPLYNHHWRLYTRPEGDPSEEILLDSVTNQAYLELDDHYLEGIEYRVQLDAVDRFGAPVSFNQVFASIRDLSAKNIWFRWGSRHATDQIFALAPGGEQVIPSQYYGSSIHYFSFASLGVNRDLEQMTSLLPGVSLKFDISYDLANGSVTLAGKNGGYTFDTIDELPLCAEDYNPVETEHPRAPYPIVVNAFEVTDAWTGKTYDYGDTQLTLVHEEGGLCDFDYTPENGSGNFAVEGLPLTWYYNSAALTDFSFDGTAGFDTNLYGNDNYDWNIEFAVYGPDNLVNPVVGRKKLSQYLAESRQSLQNGRLFTIHARHLHPFPDNSDDSDAALTRWMRALFAEGYFDLLTNPGSEQRIRAYINISAIDPNNGETVWLMRSLTQHAGGIEIDFKPGLPPERAGVTSLAYNSHSPDQIKVSPNQPRLITIRQNLDVNSDLANYRIQWDAFQWRWTSQLGTWDGNSWQGNPTWYNLGAASSPFETARVSYLRDRHQIQLEWTVHSDRFPVAFWPTEQTQMPVALEVAYRPSDAPVVLPNNPQAVSRIMFMLDGTEQSDIVFPFQLASGTDKDAPLAVLEEDLRTGLHTELRNALQKAFAPEPVMLRAGNPYAGDQLAWALADRDLPANIFEQPPTDWENAGLYALLRMPFDGINDTPAQRAFIVPYPDHLHAQMPWAEETPSATQLSKSQPNNWVRQGHVFYNYAQAPNDTRFEFRVAVFVRASTLKRNPLPETFAPTYQTTPLAALFNGTSFNFGASPTHNRLVNIAYPDPENPEKRLVSIKFVDLNGNPQETRSMPTMAPAELRNHVMIDNVALYDQLGRPEKVSKSFYTEAGAMPAAGNAPTTLVQAGLPEHSFALGSAFFENSDHLIGDKGFPYVSFKYSNDDTRSDLMAILPTGPQARDTQNPLRYRRTHRLVAPVDQNSGETALINQNNRHLLLAMPEAATHLLPIGQTTSVTAELAQNGGAGFIQPGDTFSTYYENNVQRTAQASAASTPPQAVFGLEGIVDIDADGFVKVNLSGASGRLILTINNPPPALLTYWGFQVVNGGAPSTFDNNVIHLPSTYLNRWYDYGTRPIGDEDATDLATVVYHQYDERGRLIQTWPPRALKLYKNIRNAWTVAKASANAVDLTTRFEYDHRNRLVATTDPDRGTHHYVRDRHGRIRFQQRGRKSSVWREFAYDAQGRIIGERAVALHPANIEYVNLTLQEAVDHLYPFAVNIPDIGFLSGISSLYILPDSKTKITYSYDHYDVLNIRNPFTTTASEPPHYWPHMADLEQQNPWTTDIFRFGDPDGQLVEVQTEHNAQRLYYNLQGHVVCRVSILRGMLEPQVTWFQYDGTNKVTAIYNQTQNQGVGYEYDAFDRVVAVWDLTPVAERMLLNVAFQARTAATAGETFTAAAALGPLVDDDADLTPGTGARRLAAYRYETTGHVTEEILGNDVDNEIATRFRYDMRDWLISKTTQINGIPVFEQNYDYDGIGGLFDADYAVPARYDGSITHLDETYHLTNRGQGYQRQTIRHKYAYDGLGQLREANTQWDEWIRNRYTYDQHGNRLHEQRVRQFSAQQETRYDATYAHEIDPGSNRLLGIQQSGGDPYGDVSLSYTATGSVERIERRRQGTSSSAAADVTQTLAYAARDKFEHPRSITTTLSSSEQARHDLRYPAVSMDFRYDHEGNRIRRSTRIDGRETVTYFLPSGYENATEFDRWGRAKRGYLFSGSDRIGYKSKHHTGVYIKDHLDSTKMVAALYRGAEAREAQNREAPGSNDGGDGDGETAPAADDDDPERPLVALSFNSDLRNDGTLAAGSAVGELSYLSREGNHALWLESGEIVNIPNNPDTTRLANQFTVSAWIYDSDIDDGSEDYGTIVTVGTGRSIRYNPLHFYIDGNKNIVLRLGGGAEGWQFFGGFPRLPHRTWVHVTATYDGSQVRLFQNGAEVTQPQPVTLSALYPSQQIAVGDWVDYDGYRWDGGLDEVHLFAQALSPAAVTELYLRGLSDAAVQSYAPALARRGNASSEEKERIAALLAVRHSDSDPFGISLRQEEGQLARAEGEPHQFTGQEREPELGLVYMNGRWYAPEFGRFLQIDPMNQFWNSYSYVGNNPINRNDPSGMYTAQEEFMMLATLAFSNGNYALGYMYVGLSGFASTTDNLSKLVDHYFVWKRDDVTGWTFVGAGLELLDVIPIGRIFTASKKFLGIGKVAKTVDAAADAKGALSVVDDVAEETSGFVQKAKQSGCFVAGTLVWTEQGLIPIEQVNVGDQVWSRSDTTGLLSLKTVERELVHHDMETYYLELSGTAGTQIIEATGDHPFWMEPGRWEDLAKLRLGNRIWTESGWQTVTNVEKQPGTKTVYNFTVADFHSYFVGVHKTWAHNNNCNKIADSASEGAEAAADTAKATRESTEAAAETAQTIEKATGDQPWFDLLPRVQEQLLDPRMGRLQGQLDAADLNRLLHTPDAQRFYDLRQNFLNINIIQEVQGKLLRITVASDSFTIISVGPIKARNIRQYLSRGDFLPIGKEAVD